MEKNEDKASTYSLLKGMLVFLVLGLLAIWFAMYVTVNLLSDISTNNDTIIFDKVGFYFYGIGIGLLVFPVVITYSKLFKFNVSKKGEYFINGFLAFSVIMTLTLPHVVHDYIETYVENNAYITCKGKSKRSLYITTIEYSKEGKCK